MHQASPSPRGPSCASCVARSPSLHLPGPPLWPVTQGGQRGSRPCQLWPSVFRGEIVAFLAFLLPWGLGGPGAVWAAGRGVPRRAWGHAVHVLPRACVSGCGGARALGLERKGRKPSGCGEPQAAWPDRRPSRCGSGAGLGACCAGTEKVPPGDLQSPLRGPRLVLSALRRPQAGLSGGRLGGAWHCCCFSPGWGTCTPGARFPGPRAPRAWGLPRGRGDRKSVV